MRVVFRADVRLGKLASFSQDREQERANKHRDPSTGCKKEVVCKIPFDCGLCYVGQTGHCINDRLLEHKRNVRNRCPNSELAKHISECGSYSPLWKETSVLFKERDV